MGECIGLLTGQTLPVLQSARLEAAMPLGAFFRSSDPAYPNVIFAFSGARPKRLTMDLPHSRPIVGLNYRAKL